mgnify:FL=1
MKNERTEERYGIRRAAISLPLTDLLVVPHRNDSLTVRYPASGPGNFSHNGIGWGGDDEGYYHSPELPKLFFRTPTTSESISVIAHDKEMIKGSSGVQLGEIIISPEGVYANPPDDLRGATITVPMGASPKDIFRGILLPYLSQTEKVNGIWLLPNGKIEGVRDFGFAPYETFTQCMQNWDTFIKSGLARLLEHTKGPVTKLEEIGKIASPKRFTVNVEGFEPSNNNDWPHGYFIVSIHSDLGCRGSNTKLTIDCSLHACSNIKYQEGYAYGVLEK